MPPLYSEKKRVRERERNKEKERESKQKKEGIPGEMVRGWLRLGEGERVSSASISSSSSSVNGSMVSSASWANIYRLSKYWPTFDRGVKYLTGFNSVSSQ